jgi:hypothetical protein
LQSNWHSSAVMVPGHHRALHLPKPAFPLIPFEHPSNTLRTIKRTTPSHYQCNMPADGQRPVAPA